MNISSMPLGSSIFGVFIEQRGGPGAPEVGTTHQGAPGPPGSPWWGVVPSEHPPRSSLGPLGVFWAIKISVKFRCIWTPFGIDFLRCKKHGENNNWHLAL